jgi:hypothetical protein
MDMVEAKNVMKREPIKRWRGCASVVLAFLGAAAWADEGAFKLQTGEIMLQLGERYRNLYWAAKLERWEFAAYQGEEIEELVEKLIAAQPKRAKSAGKFLAKVYPRLPEAIGTREWRRFERAFEELRTQCMACHEKNGKAFITLPVPKSASSPVLNMQ